jgi:CheY-like chemotaxis protein
MALTASAMAGNRERFLEAGMDDCLSKPVDMADLTRVLARLAARP